MLAGILVWMGIQKRGIWKKPRFYLAICLSFLTMGQLVLLLEKTIVNESLALVRDSLFLGSGFFLLVCAFQSVSSVRYREKKFTLFIHGISIFLTLTLAILSLHLRFHIKFSPLQLLTFTLGPVFIFTTIILFILYYLSNGRRPTRSEFIFLGSCFGIGICSFIWHHIQFDGPKIHQSYLNQILSFCVIMLGYGGNDLFQHEETKLEPYEKLSEIGQLVGNISHEIGTPLSAIFASIGTIKLLLNEKLKPSLSLFKNLSPEENVVWMEVLEQNMSHARILDIKVQKAHAKEMIPFLEGKVEDVKFVSQSLAEFGFSANTIPTSLLLLDQNKIKSVLDSVKIFADIIRASEIIHLSTHRSEKLIKSLKNYLYHSGDSKMDEVYLHIHIQDIVSLYYDKFSEDVKIQIEIPKEIKIQCYVDEISQVWINIINNSLDAMENKGEILIKAYREKDNTLITISDNGPGIPFSSSSKIFDAFYTTKKAGFGTGLGLAISKSIIEKHRGNIEFVSDVSLGRGTKFIISLPTVQK